MTDPQRLADLRAGSGSVLLSHERGSAVADPVASLVRRAGIPVALSSEVHADATRRGGATSLMSFAYMGAVELVLDLLRRGAELEAEDEEGFTALMYAANAGQKRIVDVLLKAGADVNHCANEGTTALMFAAQHGYLEIVKKLLANRAATTVRRVDGLTAHEAALRNGHHRVASIISAVGGRSS